MRCFQMSQYYCLDAYMTPDRDESQKFPRSINVTVAEEQFETLIRDRWLGLNMININDPGHCCRTQTQKYMLYGWSNRGMTPHQYLKKLSDYSNDSMPLNN